MSSLKSIVTRFPPSPTGFLHVGSLRTALYNYLFAKQNKGKFIIRIEDTDRERYVEGAVENLIKTLKWAGLEYNEGPDIGGPHGPYIQSQRLELYREYAQKLIQNHHAYYCFCTKERLENMRKSQEAKKLAPKYDRYCLNLSKEEIEKNIHQSVSHVIRQKIPEKTIHFRDIVRGELTFEASTLDDQILLKSDGYPTYHLANVVDDHLMEVTHVIRGEEWLPSTPKHILLYEACEWTPPQFAHLPLLLNPDKTKLSKRQGDVAVEDYIQKGYLKEALLNFVALLGWHPTEDEEILSMEDLLRKFSLEKVQKGGAIFNREKLDWLNGVYIRKLSTEELAKRIHPIIEKEAWFHDDPKFKEYVKLIQERLKTLSEAPNMLKCFFIKHHKYDLALFENEKMKVDRGIAKKSLEEAKKMMEENEIDYKSEESIKAHLLNLALKMQIKNGQLLWPLRVSLTNEVYSPGVFEMIHILGKEKTLQRIHDALGAMA